MLTVHYDIDPQDLHSVERIWYTHQSGDSNERQRRYRR